MKTFLDIFKAIISESEPEDTLRDANRWYSDQMSAAAHDAWINRDEYKRQEQKSQAEWEARVDKFNKEKSTKELVEKLSFSQMSVYKDLDELSKRNDLDSECIDIIVHKFLDWGKSSKSSDNSSSSSFYSNKKPKLDNLTSRDLSYFEKLYHSNEELFNKIAEILPELSLAIFSYIWSDFKYKISNELMIKIIDSGIDKAREVSSFFEYGKQDRKEVIQKLISLNDPEVMYNLFSSSHLIIDFPELAMKYALEEDNKDRFIQGIKNKLFTISSRLLEEGSSEEEEQKAARILAALAKTGNPDLLKKISEIDADLPKEVLDLLPATMKNSNERKARFDRLSRSAVYKVDYAKNEGTDNEECYDISVFADVDNYHVYSDDEIEFDNDDILFDHILVYDYHNDKIMDFGTPEEVKEAIGFELDLDDLAMKLQDDIIERRKNYDEDYERSKYEDDDY